MKYKAFFFYVLMLFLVLQPLLVTCQAVRENPAGCCYAKNCNRKEKSQTPVSKKCDDGIACNPFASCSQAQFITVTGMSFMETVPVGNKQAIRHQHENAIAGFIADCFHPPEASAL